MSDVKVCKVMTSYGTTLVVLVPNSSNYNALTSAIEKKHANLYGNLYGEVRVTRMDGFLHENDEGAGIGVSYPVDDESFCSIPFTNYLAQLHSKKGGEKAADDVPWTKAIKDALKEAPGKKLSVKALRKAVLKTLKGEIGDSLSKAKQKTAFEGALDATPKIQRFEEDGEPSVRYGKSKQ